MRSELNGKEKFLLVHPEIGVGSERVSPGLSRRMAVRRW